MDSWIGDERLSEIEARTRVATPGPWKAFVEGRDHWGGDDFIRTGGLDDGTPDMYVSAATADGSHPATERDLDFIAHARQDVPVLTAHIRALRDPARSEGAGAISAHQGPDAEVLRATASTLGEGVVEALAEMVRTANRLPGQFRAEFSLEYQAGVDTGAEAWVCTVEGDIIGDNNSSQFSVLGGTAADALSRAAAESWRRVPPVT